jgi:hypothetical protein
MRVTVPSTISSERVSVGHLMRHHRPWTSNYHHRAGARRWRLLEPVCEMQTLGDRSNRRLGDTSYRLRTAYVG